MTGIVITTSPASQNWLPSCLASVRQYAGTRPILIVGNQYTPTLPASDTEGVSVVINEWNGWELGGILRGAERFESFVHLMDTTEVTHPNFFSTLDSHPSGVYLCAGFFSYLGKYVSAVIREIGVPQIHTKHEAIRLEREWNAQYLQHDHTACPFNPPLPIHTHVFEEKWGRTNMVLQNGYLTKWKGTWG